MKRILWIALLCGVSVNALASDITLDLSVTGSSQSLTVIGKTNLPPQTILSASVANPLNQGGDGYFAGPVSASVQANYTVQFGPFSKSGGRLSPGNYRVTVSTIMATGQPQEVQPFFGANGEGLTGRLVSTLPGTSEKVVSQSFQFTINPDGSIGNPAPSKPAPNAAGEVWQKVQGTDPEVYVMTNGTYNQPGCCSAKMFRTYLVANLPESDIVGAPQSIETEIEGDCETGHYNQISSIFFAGKNRSGTPSEVITEPEVVVRKVIPGSLFEKAFNMLCEIAKEQK